MNVQQWKNVGSGPSVAAARRAVRAVSGCLLGALVLAGCGQKGPLKQAPSAAAAASGASAAASR